MTKWLTADQHFNDPNIIKNAKRPFSSVEEMNAVMIQRWNERVRPSDEIFCLGDFIRAGGTKDMPAVSRILQQLNGQKWLILGNHDRKRKAITDNPHWHKVVDYHEIKVDLGGEHKQRFILFHNALRTWTNQHRGSYLCHGHSHGSLFDVGGKTTDVGVDCHNFYPISVYDVDKYMRNRPVVTNDCHQVANPYSLLPTEQLEFLFRQCGPVDYASVVSIDAEWTARKQIQDALLQRKQV